MSMRALLALCLAVTWAGGAGANDEVAGTIRVNDAASNTLNEPTLRPAPPLARYEVFANERLSATLARWADSAGYRVVWRGQGDIEIEAGMGFDAPGIRGALRDLTNLLAGSNPGLKVRTYSNNVIVVEVRE